MYFTIWQHLLLAWAAFALLVIFVLRYGTDHERTHPYFSQVLLIGYLITAIMTLWPLMATPGWRSAAFLPFGATVVSLGMIGLGSILERAGKKAHFPTDAGGKLIGKGGGVAIAGLLLGLVLLTVAASLIGAATFSKS